MLGGLIINMAKHEVLTKCHPKISPVIVGLEMCGTKNLKTTTLYRKLYLSALKLSKFTEFGSGKSWES